MASVFKSQSSILEPFKNSKGSLVNIISKISINIRYYPVVHPIIRLKIAMSSDLTNP